MGIHNVDWDATRKYQGDTRVYLDGREVMGVKDWKKRKGELASRSGGQCEYVSESGERCNEKAVIPSHIIPRHPVRDDRLSNLKHQCFQHDRMTEKQNWRKTRFGEHS
jgi:hypothetical protein